MVKKGGGSSFLDRLRSKKRGDGKASDQDRAGGKGSAKQAKGTAHEGNEAPPSTGDEEQAIQMFLEQEEALHIAQPANILDIPLDDEDGGETTLRTSLYKDAQALEEEILRTTVRLERPVKSAAAPTGRGARARGSQGTERSSPPVDTSTMPDKKIRKGPRMGEAVRPASGDSVPFSHTLEAEKTIEIALDDFISAEERATTVIEGLSFDQAFGEDGEIPALEELSVEIVEEEPIAIEEEKPAAPVADVELEAMRAEADKLGIRSHVAALASYVRNCDTPMTIGILGDRGSGKTCFMRMIGLELQAGNRSRHATQAGDSSAEIIWFNATDFSPFSGRSGLSLFLLGSVIKHASDSMSKRRRKTALHKRLQGIQQDVRILSKALAADVPGKRTAQAEAAQTSEDGQEAVPLDRIQQAASNVKTGMRVLARDYLRDAGCRKLVIFVDEIDDLDTYVLVELLEGIKIFLDATGLVIVAACDDYSLKQALDKRFESGESHVSGKAFFDRVFQFTYRIPMTAYKVEAYLERLLPKAGFSLAREDLLMFRNLLNYSIGFNPRAMRQLIDKLTLPNSLLTGPSESRSIVADKEKLAQLQRMLFGIGCLDSAFPRIYDLLFTEAAHSDEHEDNLSGLVALLQRPLPSEEEVMSHLKIVLEQASSGPDGSHGDAAIPDLSRPAKFLRLFRKMISVENKRELRAAETSSLVSAIKLMSLGSGTPAEDLATNVVRESVTASCARIVEALARIMDDYPQVHNKWAHAEAGGKRYRYKLWFKPEDSKAAWGSRRLFYALAFDAAQPNSVTVGCYCNRDRVHEARVRPTRTEQLENLPILGDGVFTFAGPTPGGWVRIDGRILNINWRTKSGIGVEQAYRIAGDLNKLIQATSDCFDVGDVPEKARKRLDRPKKKRVKTPCPKCGKKELEIVSRLMDGSFRFQCKVCRAKVKTKPKAPGGGP